MHGNVYEWCRDWYQDSYEGLSKVDPEGPAGGALRVCRGGSWLSDAGVCRSASRSRSTPGRRSNYLGFRLALQFHGK
jgi:formylglycine-generating enzyme required for sulfatase activity